MERRSVVEYLESFLRRGRECAYVQPRGYRAERWSYRQVAETAFRFARELEKRGIGKGERVLVWGPNSAEWVVVFFGCALRGAIVVPLDEAGTADFTQRVYQHVDGKLLVCSREHVLPSIPVVVLEDLQETLSIHASAPYDAAAIGPSDISGNCFHFRHHCRTKRCRDHPRQRPRQYRAARSGNPEISEVRAPGPSRSLPQPAALEPCVRTIPGNISCLN